MMSYPHIPPLCSKLLRELYIDNVYTGMYNLYTYIMIYWEYSVACIVTWGKMDRGAKWTDFGFLTLKVNNKKIYQQHPKSDGRVVFSSSKHFKIIPAGYCEAQIVASR